MKSRILSGPFILVALVLLTSGCMESPVQEPVVTVTDIAVSDLSLQTMTVNTTLNIFNPNPIGARLNNLVFDVSYPDGGRNYLGHGEKAAIEVNGNGNTTVIVPVTVGNVEAARAVASLVQKGSITLNVNGSAFIDVKVTTFEKKFEQSREFSAGEFEGLLPVTTVPGTGISVGEGIKQLGGLLGSVS